MPSLVIEFKPSAHFANETIQPLFIVVHCIGYTDPLKSLDENGASAHFLIPQQKNETELLAYQLVDPTLKAFHAGASAWKNYTGLNQYSIGIEINMPNYARALENSTLDFLHFENFQPQQIQVLEVLVQQLQKQFSIPPENVIGHSDVAPLRKTDPGPTINWEQLARKGIGFWPTNECPPEVKRNLTAARAQESLRAAGYSSVPNSGEFDAQPLKIIGAANLHWTPGCFNKTSGSAGDCYPLPFNDKNQSPFSEQLACVLDNVASGNRAQSSAFPLLAVILSSGGVALLALILVCVLYKRHANKMRYERLQEQKLELVASEAGVNSPSLS